MEMFLTALLIALLIIILIPFLYFLFLIAVFILGLEDKLRFDYPEWALKAALVIFVALFAAVIVMAALGSVRC